MATVAELLVKITADVGSIKGDLERGSRSFEDFGKKASSSFDDAGKKALSFGDILKANILSDVVMGGFRALGGAISSAVGSLKDFAVRGLETASNLQEVQNVVNVTFGEGAAQIDSFAKSAASAFGLSELSAKQYTGTLGAMLKSTGLSEGAVLEMSTSLTGLTGDFASFYNLDHEEAFNKLRAGISGETEPLKQLGINMSVASLEAFALEKGITESFNAMTEAEKATLRYQFIMDATADAQGDFARTSDGFANQQRILQLNMENLAASLGSKLLPSVNELTTAFNQLLSGNISASEFGATAGKVISDLANMIIDALPELVDIGVEIINALLKGITDNLDTIVQAALDIAMSLTTALLNMLPTLLQMGATILIQLVKGIAAALPTLIPQIVSVLLQMVQVFLDNLPLLITAGLQLLQGLVTGLIAAIPVLVDALPEIIDSIVAFFVDSLPEIIEAGVELFVALIEALPEIINGIVAVLPDLLNGVIKGLIDNIDVIIGAGIDLFIALIENLPAIISGIVAALPELIDGIAGGIEDLFWKIVDVGENLVHSIWQGIKDAAGWIWTKVSGFFTDLTDRIKNFFGIGSPSKLFAEYGNSLALGLGTGFASQMRDTVRDMARFGPRVAAAAASLIPATNMTLATAGAYNVTGATPAAATFESEAATPIYININGLSVREEADVQKISAQLYRLQQDRLRQRGFNI
jgi:hypothetical protein